MSDTKNMAMGTHEKGGQAKDCMDNTTGTPCGPSRSTADIQPHMNVMASCGSTMGKVDHLEGNAIKLTKRDSLDGHHHFVPTNWVDHVDNHVHLKKNAEETKAGWTSDAASCASCGA